MKMNNYKVIKCREHEIEETIADLNPSFRIISVMSCGIDIGSNKTSYIKPGYCIVVEVQGALDGIQR